MCTDMYLEMLQETYQIQASSFHIQTSSLILKHPFTWNVWERICTWSNPKCEKLGSFNNSAGHGI